MPEVREMQQQLEQLSAQGTAAAAVQAGTKSMPQLEKRWNLALRIGFRFAFAYLILYSFPFPLTEIPGVSYLFRWYSPMWQKMVIWTGAHVLHLSQPVQYAFTGSGDTTYSYIQNLLVLVYAVVAMLLWSVLDRKRKNYVYLQQWLWLYVRLVLGVTLLSYGAAKVIKSQFPDPFLWRLLEPYGDSSPMGLLWTFMGYSTPYTFFAGMVEMVAGALLFVPRLATLGALLSIGAMGNVFMLNMSYDVPVKIYSFNLLSMGAFLLLPEIRRLANVFVLNRQPAPNIPPLLFRRRWLNVCVLVLQLAFLLYTAGFDLYQTNQGLKRFTATPPLYGIYAVDEFAVDGQVRPPLFTDESRWRRFTFDRFNSVGISPADGPTQRYIAKVDLAGKSLQLTRRGDQWKASFTLETPSPGLVTLNGEMDGKKIQAKLRKLDSKSFLLNSRGFHWINEFPYNR
jgi:hypothetical protein